MSIYVYTGYTISGRWHWRSHPVSGAWAQQPQPDGVARNWLYWYLVQ
jgi:hypothetical protein